MHNIPENFSGYLTIEDSVFVYHASKTKVTMFPASKDSREQFKIIAELGQKKIVGPQFIYGTYQGCLIAFLMRSNIKLNLFGLDPSCYFITPLIMKSAGNSENFYSQLSEDWTKFHAITFYSGNINFLYSPDEMIDKFKLLSFENAVNAIPIKDINTYSHIIKCNLSGEEIEIIISIGHNELPKNKEKNLSGFSVGNLNSFIRLSFNSSKDFNEVDNYIKLIKKLVSFLTKQNNVFFNICLEQKNTNGKLLKTVDCKIFDTYPNYSINEQPSVISLIQLKKYLPVLITKLYNNNYSALFDVLPIDNAKKYVVSISDIQNICSTLEVMYELKKIK